MYSEVFVLYRKLGQRNLVPVYVCVCMYVCMCVLVEGGCFLPFGSKFFFLPSVN
jgi:hypothetical protein